MAPTEREDTGARTRITRRGFGRAAGVAGIGAAVAGGLGGTLLASRSGGVAGALVATSTETEWHVGGVAPKELAPFDETIKSFMQKEKIPGGQLAVTHKGRLVLARSYAWTDDSDLRPGPTALFRVASLSKTITSTAINTLVQNGKLRLGTPVGDLIDVRPPDGQDPDSRWAGITVRRLLHHLGGWDRDTSGDYTYEDPKVAEALGTSLPVDRDQVIAYGAGKRLDHDPGTRYAYSNYGYLLLGRIVEKVTGKPYDQYVKEAVLAPKGITRMRLGRSLREQAAPGEVPYFHPGEKVPTVLDDSGTKVPAQYGGYRMETRDAQGGWISSAVDMVRYASVYDEPNDVLNAESIARAWSKPENYDNADTYYALGWNVRPVDGGTGRNTWHTGGLDGAASILVRTSSGRSWCALFDRTADIGPLDQALWDAARKVETWPEEDLYPEFFH